MAGNKNKRGRKKEEKGKKEGRGFGRLPSFFFPPFLFVYSRFFLVVILVQIWLYFLCGSHDRREQLSPDLSAVPKIALRLAR